MAMKWLIHTQKLSGVGQVARRLGAQRGEVAWCQLPENVRGLPLETLAGMKQTPMDGCESKRCDETLAYLRRIGWSG
jgi:hypothetical protein